MAKVAIIQLARFGDIINILPMAKIIAEQEGEPPTVFVSQGYESILQGVSYAKVGIISECDLPIPMVAQSLSVNYSRVLIPMVAGKGIRCKPQTNSFAKEAWKQAGMLDKWGQCPVFDRRNTQREKRLIQQHIADNPLPVFLVNLQSFSSPYPFANNLWRELRFHFGDSVILINLAAVKSYAIYDLLGLYDRAAALITTDTATLHLAAASKVPTVALLADKPMWAGSITPRRFEMELRHDESLFQFENITKFLQSRIR